MLSAGRRAFGPLPGPTGLPSSSSSCAEVHRRRASSPLSLEQQNNTRVLKKNEVTMSELNGDKARFQRLRRAGLRRRQRARKAWAAMQREAIRIHPGSDSEQSGGVRERVGTLHLVTGASVTE